MTTINKQKQVCFLVTLLWLLAACQNEPNLTDVEVQGTVEAAVAGTMIAQGAVNTTAAQTAAAPEATAVDIPTTAPPTQTASPTLVPDTATPPNTATPTPTDTAVPTETPIPPTDTPVPTSTNTPAPVQPTSPPPPPTLPPNPAFGGQYLPNGSFEDGWYNMWGVPELQLPNNWGLEWDEGPTGYGGNEWDQWYRPETRVLPYFQLPGHERGLLIQDGEHTIKIFKGNGPLSFRMYQDVSLPAGTYKLIIRAFPDLVMGYNGESKVFADDPFAGEIRLVTPGGGTAWLLPAFGAWNEYTHTFTLNEPATVRLGIGVRARYALLNNGWFFDNWSLEKAGG